MGRQRELYKCDACHGEVQIKLLKSVDHRGRQWCGSCVQNALTAISNPRLVCDAGRLWEKDRRGQS